MYERTSAEILALTKDLIKIGDRKMLGENIVANVMALSVLSGRTMREQVVTLLMFSVSDEDWIRSVVPILIESDGEAAHVSTD
jgi:hypothetical protein